MIDAIKEALLAELEQQEGAQEVHDQEPWTMHDLDIPALAKAVADAVGGTDWEGVDVGQMVRAGDRIRAEYGDAADTATELTVTPAMTSWTISRLFGNRAARYRRLKVKPTPAPQLEADRGSRFD